MTAASVTAVAALVASFWLLRHDGGWDTYRQPLFLPFLSTAVLMTVFSTTAAAGERDEWRRLVSRVAIAGAVVQALAGVIVSRNPIFDLHATDIVLLAVLEALLIAGAGAATELGERIRPDTWIRTAWCATALMTLLARFPRVLLFFH
jgi:hypothetical protein